MPRIRSGVAPSAALLPPRLGCAGPADLFVIRSLRPQRRTWSPTAARQVQEYLRAAPRVARGLAPRPAPRWPGTARQRHQSPAEQKTVSGPFRGRGAHSAARPPCWPPPTQNCLLQLLAPRQKSLNIQSYLHGSLTGRRLNHLHPEHPRGLTRRYRHLDHCHKSPRNMLSPAWLPSDLTQLLSPNGRTCSCSMPEISLSGPGTTGAASDYQASPGRCVYLVSSAGCQTEVC